MPDVKVAGDLFGPMRDGTYWFVNYCEYSRWSSVDTVRSVRMDLVQPKLEQLFGFLGNTKLTTVLLSVCSVCSICKAVGGLHIEQLPLTGRE